MTLLRARAAPMAADEGSLSSRPDSRRAIFPVRRSAHGCRRDGGLVAVLDTSGMKIDGVMGKSDELLLAFRRQANKHRIERSDCSSEPTCRAVSVLFIYFFFFLL